MPALLAARGAFGELQAGHGLLRGIVELRRGPAEAVLPCSALGRAELAEDEIFNFGFG